MGLGVSGFGTKHLVITDNPAAYRDKGRMIIGWRSCLTCFVYTVVNPYFGPG